MSTHPEFQILPSPPIDAPVSEVYPKMQEQSLVVSPMAVIELAIRQGANADALGKLMELQFQWERNEARKAYIRAFNEFKLNLPSIEKNKHVEFGTTKYDHATLDKVCEILIEALGKVGITHSWKTGSEGGKVRVTCVLTHEMGHSEEAATLESAPDASGGKNSIQAIGSAVTYLERYTLLGACGMATKGQDDDGASFLDDEMRDLIEIITKSETVKEMQGAYKEAFQRALAKKNKNALYLSTLARDEWKKAHNVEVSA
jgi:hypothetical protein